MSCHSPRSINVIFLCSVIIQTTIFSTAATFILIFTLPYFLALFMTIYTACIVWCYRTKQYQKLPLSFHSLVIQYSSASCRWDALVTLQCSACVLSLISTHFLDCLQNHCEPSPHHRVFSLLPTPCSHLIATHKPRTAAGPASFTTHSLMPTSLGIKQGYSHHQCFTPDLRDNFGRTTTRTKLLLAERGKKNGGFAKPYPTATTCCARHSCAAYGICPRGCQCGWVLSLRLRWRRFGLS